MFRTRTRDYAKILKIPEAALFGSADPFPPPVLAGAAGLAGITALAFSNMDTTWSLEAGWGEMRVRGH